MKDISKLLRRKLVYRKPVFVVLFFLMFLTLFFAQEGTAGHNNSSLSGTYVMHIFHSGFQGVGTGGWGTNDELRSEKIVFIFDGAGNFTSSFTEVRINRELLEQSFEYNPGDWVFGNTYNTGYSADSDTDSGTYSVASDGTVTVTFVGGDGGTAMLSSDGNTFIFSEAEFEDSEHWGSVSFGVGVKQGSGFTNSSLSGTYVMHIFNSGFQGGIPDAWGENDEISSEEIELIFDGAGNVTISSTEGEINRELSDQPLLYLAGDYVFENTYNTTYSTDSDTDSGTYSVTSNGTITITLSDGGGTAMLSSDGNTFIFSEAEFENSERWGSVSFGVGVKQGSGFDISSLSGTYVMHIFNSGFQGGAPGAWGENDEIRSEELELIFDGAGNVTASFTEGQIEREFLDRPFLYIPGVPGDWVFENTYNTTYSTDSDTDSGTYSVASDGTITITLSDGGGTAMLSSDGNTFVFSEAEFEDSEQWGSVSFGVGVKQVKDFGDELAMDFGGLGLWDYDGTTWRQLSSSSPEYMTGWSGGLAMDFSHLGFGLWNFDGTTWTQISSSDVEVMTGWANGLAMDFGGLGLWNFDGTAWTQVSGSNVEGMTGWANGLAMDFGGLGLWNFDGSIWTQVSGSNVEGMTGWANGLAMDFGGLGLWNFDGTTWTQVSGSNVEGMAGWANGLAMDFGGLGLWNFDGSIWTQVSGSDVEGMTGWIDGLAMDFGGLGLWNYDGTTWTQISGSDVEDMDDVDLF